MISCLMLTLATPDRFPYVKRSIAAYCRQTASSKELVMLVNGGSDESRQNLIDYVDALERRDIRIISSPAGMILGEMRNLSIEAAAGDVLCQWDDDDLYHPLRLERQFDELMEGDFEATYFQEVIQYFPETRTLYWTNWRETEAGAHPGTMMVKRHVPLRYPTEGPSASLGEDLSVALFLKQRGKTRYIAGAPHLFVYVSHGKNIWSDDHHRMLATQLSISQGLLRRREVDLRAGLAPFDFGPGEVSVQGNNGLGFVI